MAVLIHRHTADGVARSSPVASFLVGALAQVLLPALELAGHGQVGQLTRPEAHLGRKALRTTGHQENMLALLHDCTREPDGVLNKLHAGDGTDPEILTIHKARIQLDLPVGVEKGATPGVERVIIFHDNHGRLHRIEGGAAGRQNGPTCLRRSIRPLAAGLKKLGLPLAGPAVDNDGWLHGQDYSMAMGV